MRLTRLDAQIVHALQVWPRAPWALVASLLYVDSRTVARRWARLSSAGIAWLSAYPADRASSTDAVVELRAAPAAVAPITDALCDMDDVAMVQSCMGHWNLSLHWRGKDIAALERFVSERLAGVEGIEALRSFLVLDTPREGSTWRIGALTAEQESLLQREADRSLADADAQACHHDIDVELVELLREDPRMSLTMLAKRTATSVNTVKRHLGHLLRSGGLIIRCELSRPLSDNPVTVRFFGSVERRHAEQTIATIAGLPDVRSCLVLLGAYDLTFTAWLESARDVGGFETRLERAAPALSIRERDLVLRSSKVAWRVIDDDGRRRR
ncbi:Lrp/AsnC family transcriptional regulator [Microbacterium sp. No. 7]|uniref:Lrp/AsnC family transcriptional regulator n=1 Tax=Microbacterium sp. No. 7 TaxID=1714373 RepID=UPI0006D214FE|nr:Lrp/AsnC family transcriptional regulator [Microbacterium sp. No. 7]ALJ18403.1 hypothetical protein AOA12_00085 [Microbacterium sp. No. 7]